MLVITFIGFIISYAVFSKGVSGEEVIVFNKKPLIFGRGGVSDTPLMSGRTFVAPTTETVTFKHIPIAYTEQFDDMVSADNVPVNTTVTAILQIDGSKAPALYQGYGINWYENSVKQVFRKFIRGRISMFDMPSLTSNRTIVEKIETDVNELLRSYFQELSEQHPSGHEFPIRIVNIAIDRVYPNKDVFEEIKRTAIQSQARKTQVERDSMEVVRGRAEKSRAIADKAYQTTMGLDANQFIQLRALEIEKEKIEMIKEHKGGVNVDVLLGNEAVPIWNVRQK